MGDGIGIPAFSQHGDRDHTTDRLPQCSRFTDGIHHLSQQCCIIDVLACTQLVGEVTTTLQCFALKTLNFISGDVSEILVQCFTRLQLFTINQQRIRTRQLVTMLVIVTEQFKSSVFNI